jgi:hypothetical protein
MSSDLKRVKNKIFEIKAKELDVFPGEIKQIYKEDKENKNKVIMNVCSEYY